LALNKQPEASSIDQMGRVVDLSFLFISYARTDLLQIAIESLRSRLDHGALSGLNYEFVVSDDCSPEPWASGLRSLCVDRLVVSPKNQGMGGNTNLGVRACRGKYVVQIQDDWRFVATPLVFVKAVQVMESDKEVGLVLYVEPDDPLPFQARSLADGTEYRVFENDHFQGFRTGSARPYSDRPHLKRMDFCIGIGPYKEKRPMHWVELEFSRRVANQSRWKVAWLPSLGSPAVFEHMGAERSFNPVYRRASRLDRLESIPLLGQGFRQVRPTLKALRDLVCPWKKIHR
jgi:GT2 family glycosyltransferase